MGGWWQRLGAVATIALVAAGALPAAAQELRDRDRSIAASRRIAEDLRRARMHYGPFYLLSSIQLADIGYDQDFFVPTSDTTSGFSFGISAPQRLYFTPNRKLFLSVDAAPQWSRFSRGTSRNQWGFKSRADAQFLLNHLYLDTYAIHNNELRADTGEISSLLTRRHVEVGTTGELKYSSRSSLTFSALARSQHFPTGSDQHQPNLPLNLLDRSEHAYRGAFVHKTFPLTSVILAAEYAGYSFSQAVYKNSRRSYAGAGLAYESGRTAVRLEGGVSRLDFLRPDQHDFRGGVGSFSMNRRATERWRLGGSLSRDLNFSIFVNWPGAIHEGNGYVANRASLSTDYAVTRHFSVNAAYNVVEDLYDVPTDGANSGGIERRKDRITFPSVGWIYSRQFVAGGFDVGYLKRTSNFPITESDGIRVIVHLSLTP